MSAYLSESLELIPGSPDWVRNFGEPMEEYGPRTCDWGDCDEPAVTLRNDVLGYGWLPACEGCRMHPGRTWPDRAAEAEAAGRPSSHADEV